MHDHLCIKELDCQQSNLVVALHHDQVTHTSGKNKHTANKFAVLDREMCLSKP